jgi:hypothetical protein
MHGLSARGPSKGISAFLPGLERIAVKKRGHKVCNSETNQNEYATFDWAFEK